jgi:dimethylargininase
MTATAFGRGFTSASLERTTMLRNEGERLTRVVVSTPSKEYFAVSDVTAHNLNEVADPETTVRQHRALQKEMADAGAEVTDAHELEGHPNSVFTRDASLVTPEGYIELRVGLETRRGEEAWLAGVLEDSDEPCAGVIEAPGTVEGGDVILVGGVALVGQSARTNESGVVQLSELLKKMGYEVRVALVNGYLHLGGAMSAIAPDRLLVVRDEYPDGFFDGFDVVEVDKRGPSTGNVICVGPNAIIGNVAENGEAMETLDANGVDVHAVDLSEFRKGAGGPTCLILPVERVS